MVNSVVGAPGGCDAEMLFLPEREPDRGRAQFAAGFAISLTAVPDAYGVWACAGAALTGPGPLGPSPQGFAPRPSG
jgi:hypothetical protein